jgi:hypothetical protein
MGEFLPLPVGIPVVLLLAGVSIAGAGLSVHRFREAYRLAGQYRSAVWFVRGIRCLIISLTASAWAAGVLYGQTWLLIIGLVILAQELYEGFVLSAALREGERIEAGQRSHRFEQDTPASVNGSLR